MFRLCYRNGNILANYDCILMARKALTNVDPEANLGCFIHYTSEAVEVRGLTPSKKYGQPVHVTTCPSCDKPVSGKIPHGSWVEFFHANRKRCKGCDDACDVISALRASDAYKYRKLRLTEGFKGTF